jgi:hypothetical protein
MMVKEIQNMEWVSSAQRVGSGHSGYYRHKPSVVLFLVDEARVECGFRYRS